MNIFGNLVQKVAAKTGETAAKWIVYGTATAGTVFIGAGLYKTGKYLYKKGEEKLKEEESGKTLRDKAENLLKREGKKEEPKSE